MTKTKSQFRCKAAGFVLALAITPLAFAETYHWTGAAGAQSQVYAWSDGGNWQEQSAPDSSDDIAVFGAMTGAPEAGVIIDLTDMNPVLGVRFEGATAPKYQLGTSIGTSAADASQSLKIADGGFVSVSSDVTQDQTVMRLSHESVKNVQLDLTNDTLHAALSIESIDRWLPSGASAQQVDLCSYGVGEIRHYVKQWIISANPVIDLYSSGKTVWRVPVAETTRPKEILVHGTGLFEIAEGAQVTATRANPTFNNAFTFDNDVTVSGSGCIRDWKQANSDTPANIKKGNDPLRGMMISANDGCTATLDVPLVPKSGFAGWIPLYADTDGGTLKLNSKNGFEKGVVLHGKIRVEAKQLGVKGCSAEETSIGLQDEVVFQPYFSAPSGSPDYTFVMDTALDATLAYAGEDEVSFDRDILITNVMYKVKSGGAYVDNPDSVNARAALANAGGGKMTYSGRVRAINTGAVFALKAETNPIEFVGSFEESETVEIALEIAGEKGVTMQSVPSNIASLTVKNAILCLATTEASSVSVPVEFQGAGNVLQVASSLTIPYENFVLADGATVNFIVPESAAVTLTGGTGTLTGVYLNGVPAKLDANGQLSYVGSRWKTAQDGDWDDGAKWIGGVPGAGDLASVDQAGASYTVSITKEPVQPGTLVLANEGSDVTTLSVEDPAWLAGTDLELRSGGRLLLGGETVMSSVGDLDFVNWQGGEVKMSGNAKMNLSSKDVTLEVGTGTLRVSDNATIRNSVNSWKISLKPGADGETSRLVFDGVEQQNIPQGTMIVGDNVTGGTGVLDVDWAREYQSSDIKTSLFQTTSVSPIYRLVVGCQFGRGVFNFWRGFVNVGNQGLLVGSATGDSLKLAKSCNVEGVLSQFGGNLSVGANNATAAAYPMGFIVGDACRLDADEADAQMSKLIGIYNLSGGTNVVTAGYSCVGVGSASGAVNQTGGSFSHDSKAQSGSRINHLTGDNNFEYPMIIGFLGGRGVYNLSGGTAEVRKELYVGGIPVADCPWANNCEWTLTSCPVIDRHDAFGALNVTGGEFSMPENNIYLAADGTGTLSIGGTGKVEANTLVLSNQSATLKFDAPVNGFTSAPLVLNGDLVIGEGAKLILDMTSVVDHEKLKTWVPLASAQGAVRGAFDGNVEIVCNEPDEKFYREQCLVVTERNGQAGLWLKTPPSKGLLLLFR